MPVLGSLRALFRRLRPAGNGWQEVPQWDHLGFSQDDELMRMAAEADDLLPDPYQEDDAHADNSPVFSSRYNFLQWRQPHRQNRRLCRVTCECGVPRTGDKPSPWLLLLSVAVLLVVCGVSGGLGAYSVFIKQPAPVIDKSIQAFSIPNHKAYIRLDSLMLARKNNASVMRYRRDVSRSVEEQYRSALAGSQALVNEQMPVRVKRSGNFEVQKYPYQIVRRWKMQVIYLAKGDQNHNIFTKERLNMVHKIENDIISHPRFKEFCLRDIRAANYDPAVKDQNSCAPLNSLLSYFFPSQDTSGNIFYDGYGKNLADIKSALSLAMNHENFYYFVDDKINKTYHKSHLLRTEVLFGAPLPGKDLTIVFWWSK